MFSVDDIEIRARVTSNFSGTPSENAQDVLTVPDNHYIFEDLFPVPVQDVVLTDRHLNFMIAREKYQPKFRIEAEYDTDAAYKSNQVNRITPQFTWRYIYDNGEKSKWAAYSRVSLPSTDSDNFIQLTFDDDWIRSSATLGLIKGIDIAVRYSNADPFRFIKTIERGDLQVTNNYTFAFYNDAEYPIVPSDGDGAVDTQVLEAFDWVPDISGTNEIASDEDGSTRILDGAVKFGFDPIRPDVQIESEAALLGAFGVNIYKKNSRYQFGITYAKDGGKRSAVFPFEPFTTPGWIDDGYSPSTVKLTINHLPPPDATHYYIVRKKNLSVQRWKPLNCQQTASESVADIVQYGVLGTNEGGFTAGSFGDAGNTHVRFRALAPWLNQDPTDDVVNVFDNSDAKWFFPPSKGDRFRVILNYGITLTGSAAVDDDYELDAFEYAEVATGGTPSHNAQWVWLYAKLTPSTPDYTDTGTYTNDNFLVELYTPRLADDGIYYEIIGGNITNGYHDLTTFSSGGGQQPQTSSQPAIITLHGTGDAYWRANMVPNYPGLLLPTDDEVEVESAYRFTDSKTESIGKPTVEDPTQKATFYADRIYTSDIYVQGTSINGLSSIRPLNYIELNSSYGILKKLKMNGDVMLAICEYRVQPIYVGKNRMLDVSGNNTIGRTSRLLNLAKELEEMAGTKNPESVMNAFGATYFYDVFNGKWWRYNNGLFPISDYGKRKYFRDAAVGLGYEDPSLNWHPAGYDPKYDMPIQSIRIQGDGIYTETYGFREKVPQAEAGFMGRFDFTPEMFCALGQELISFRNGKTYHHNDSPTYCSFYGVQYTPSFTIAVNPEPNEIKQYWNIRVVCPQQKLIAPNDNSILIPATAMYGSHAGGSGMASRLKEGKFVNYESSWYADFQNDMNDSAAPFGSMTPGATRKLAALLEGRPLRGYYLLIKLQPKTNNIFFAAYETSVEWTPSFVTKKA